MRIAVPALLAALVSPLVGCRSNAALSSPDAKASSSPLPTAVPSEAPGTPEEEAIRLAKVCGTKDPTTYRSVGGSPLLYDRARSHRCTTCTPQQQLVTVPEENPTTRPSGIDLLVDLASGTCKRVPMD